MVSLTYPDKKEELISKCNSLLGISGESSFMEKQGTVASASTSSGMKRVLVVDVILLDYEMPGMDGKETFERILADKEMCNIPVIFLTGVAVKEHISAVLKLKPAGYLLKPADKEKLIATIESVV